MAFKIVLSAVSKDKNEQTRRSRQFVVICCAVPFVNEA